MYLLIRLSISGGAMPLRKSKQIFIAREKLTWYSCFRFLCFMGTCKMIMEQKLYKISLLQSSNVTNSVFLEWKLVAPMVCFKSRKDVSMPHMPIWFCIILASSLPMKPQKKTKKRNGKKTINITTKLTFHQH